MTTYTPRTLDTTGFTARSLDTESFSGRGDIGTTFLTTGTETVTDAIAPVISNVRALEIGINNVKLAWDTDEDANCYVEHCRASLSLILTEWVAGITHAHYIRTGRSYSIGSLPGETIIGFMIASSDRYGNEAWSDYYVFKTAGTDITGIAPTIST